MIEQTYVHTQEILNLNATDFLGLPRYTYNIHFSSLYLSNKAIRVCNLIRSLQTSGLHAMCFCTIFNDFKPSGCIVTCVLVALQLRIITRDRIFNEDLN